MALEIGFPLKKTNESESVDERRHDEIGNGEVDDESVAEHTQSSLGEDGPNDEHIADQAHDHGDNGEEQEYPLFYVIVITVIAGLVWMI